ncbi:MAG: FAD-binding protein [Saprospiraceae bacterium]|nr:FAD-binding protein [Saprospiraceae bacterium]
MAKQQLFVQDLQFHIHGDVLSDSTSLGLYSTDASVYQIQPIAVVLPKHDKDVRMALQIAKDHQVAILPRGGGTSLAGQTVAEAMILDFSKYMNQLLEVNEEEGWARVQPGLVRDELNAKLKPLGLHFAPDPATSSRANVGGMIGNNSSGTKSIVFGKTVDHVIELKVLLEDGTPLHTQALDKADFIQKGTGGSREGEIYRELYEMIEDHEVAIQQAFPKVMRRVQGYNLDEFAGKETWNLSKLLCGSEGTLVTFLEAKIKLEPLPKHKSVCVVHFAEVLEAIEAVNVMLPFQPSAIEILDRTVVELSRENLTTQRHAHFIEGHPAAIQIVEFYGDTAADVLERPQRMMEELKRREMGYAYPLFPEGPIYEDVWVVRKKGLGLMLGMKGNKKPLAFIEDAGIPTQHLPEYIDRVLKLCAANDTEAAMYAHASVGVIHVRPILDLRLAEDIERFKNIADGTFQLVKEYGGSWSGEHGDGLVRSYYLPEFFGEEVYEVLRAVKHLFDPEKRMNPGKIIDAPPIDQHLRYGAAYADQELTTQYHYREDGNFANAVHMCTGVGECRKMLGGTMCPSFKATREEEHSTRGRANALRLAMSGQLGEAGLVGERLQETMDLCLSCKACKSECPSNVDMAKLKSEVLQLKYDQKGLSRRDKLIRASAQMANRFSGPMAGLVNGLNHSALGRFIIDKVAGFDSRRKLPAFAGQSFEKWFATNYQPTSGAGKTVILFADTYLNYHEPSVGVAATKLLSSCGYKVELAAVGCCQRPRISHGFLRLAKSEGGKTAQALAELMQEGTKIVVCEPSCASALVDDLPDLLADQTLGRQLKESVQMLDVFLAAELDAGNISAKAAGEQRDVLLHGHCHQKALFGTAHLKRVFEGLTGTSLEEIPSGCCGMAGSFGYEKEHYEISRKIGEQILFPAVRESDAKAKIIANGFSCRHQIEHFTDRRAKHWVEVMCEILDE